MTSKTNIQALTEDQIDALLATPELSTLTGARNHAMLVLMADAALRVSELLALRVSDIVTDGGVPNAVTIHSPEKPQAASVSLTERASQSLSRWLEMRPVLAPAECQLLFCTVSRGAATGFAEEGQELRPGHVLSDSYVRAMVRREGKKAGIAGCHPHQLRRAAVVRAFRSTGDLTVAQEQARHGSKAATVALLHYFLTEGDETKEDRPPGIASVDDLHAQREDWGSRIEALEAEHGRLATLLRSLGEQLRELRAQVTGDGTC